MKQRPFACHSMNTAILIAKEHLLSENILDSHSQLSGPIKTLQGEHEQLEEQDDQLGPALNSSGMI